MRLSNYVPARGSTLADLRDSFPWDLGLRRESSTSRWVPRTDVYDDGDSFVFEMELPGMQTDDVEIDLEDNRLTISGEQSRETTESPEDRTYYRAERYVGSFSRSFVLPDGVDAESVDATFQNGTLQIRVSKPVENGSGRREISIESKE